MEEEEEELGKILLPSERKAREKIARVKGRGRRLSPKKGYQGKLTADDHRRSLHVTHSPSILQKRQDKEGTGLSG